MRDVNLTAKPQTPRDEREARAIRKHLSTPSSTALSTSEPTSISFPIHLSIMMMRLLLTFALALLLLAHTSRAQQVPEPTPEEKAVLDKRYPFTLPNGTVIQTTRVELAYNEGLQQGRVRGYKDGYADGKAGAEPRVPLE